MNYRYVWNELGHHRHRTLVNVLGIAIGIALFVSINAVSTAYQKAVSLPFKNLGADLVVQRPEKRAVDAKQAPISMRGIRIPFSNQILPLQDLEKLKSLEGVDSTATSLLLWEFDQGGFRTIMGVDLAQPSLGPIKVKEWLKEGRFPENPGEVVLEKHYAKFHQTRVGDAFPIGGRSLKVVGLLEIKEGSQIASANIYLPLADAETLMEGETRGVNVVYLHLKTPSLLTQVKTQISRGTERGFRNQLRFFPRAHGGRFEDLRSIFFAGLDHRPGRGDIPDYQNHAFQPGGAFQRDRDFEGRRLDGERRAKATHGGSPGAVSYGRNRGGTGRVCGLLPPRISFHLHSHPLGYQPPACLRQGYGSCIPGGPASGERFSRIDGHFPGPILDRGRIGELFHGETDGQDEAGRYSKTAVKKSSCQGESCGSDKSKK